MDALERVRKQVELVEELLGELETEKSYRGIERLARAEGGRVEGGVRRAKGR